MLLQILGVFFSEYRERSLKYREEVHCHGWFGMGCLALVANLQRPDLNSKETGH
jgi:hypothetical protein